MNLTYRNKGIFTFKNEWIMKKKNLVIIFTILLAGILLSACTSGTGTSSYPGVSVDGDTVYLSNMTIMSIRVSDGGLVWRFPEKTDMKKLFYAAPIKVGDILVAGSYGNTLHGINAATGLEVWSFTGSKGRFIASPLIVNDTILAPCGDYNLYALDLQGKLLWKFTTGQRLWSQPTSDGQYVYLASMDHNLYALNLSDGSELWKVDLGAAMFYSPVLSSDGLLFISTLSSKTYAIRAENGQIAWQYQTTKPVWSAPVLIEKDLFIGDIGGTVYALDATTGRHNWQMELGGAIIGGGVATPDGLVFTTETGDLVSIKSSGEKIWTRTINGKLYSNLVLAGDRLFVPVMQGDAALVAFDLNGNQLWSFVPPK
jgi:outer membrane protein assembly factor BamB